MLPAGQGDAGGWMKQCARMVSELADFVQGIATNDISNNKLQFIRNKCEI
jgi:hypothetical protein